MRESSSGTGLGFTATPWPPGGGRPHTLLLLGALLGATLGGGCGPGKTHAGEEDGGGGTDNCVEGQRRCNVLNLQTCTGARWTDAMACTAFCDEALGCVECPPNGTLCDGANVITCDANGNRGGIRTTCKDSCVGGTCTDPCGKAAAELSYLGCDYFPTVTVNTPLMHGHFAVAVANPQSTDVDIEITRAGQSVATQTIAPGKLATVPLPWVGALKDAQVSALVKSGAYKLSSSAPVTVYQFNPLEFQEANCVDPQTGGPCYTYTNDASLLLPKSTLTGHYIAVARQSFVLRETFPGGFDLYLKSPGFIAIVGAEPVNATVNVRFMADTIAGSGGQPQAYRAGQMGTFTIGQGDVLQLLSDSPAMCNPLPKDMGKDLGQNGITFGYCDTITSDLTGTEITSDHKIAVFSGADCTFVPYNRWACDHLEQQMLPLESWGKEYLGTHSQRSPITIPDLWRVVSGVENNTITFDPANVHAPVTLTRGEWIEFPSTADFQVNGTGALQLVQYMVGEDYAGYGTGSNKPGDPAMAVSVPVEQYRKAYTFLTPDTYTESWVNVTAESGETVTLDGADILAEKFRAVGTMGAYMVARIKLQPGTHTISSANKEIGISVYGLAPYTSYMYPGGLDVKQINVQ